jgi:hypothetical protein
MQQPWIRDQINVGNRQWYDREVEMAIASLVDDEISFMEHIPTALENGIRVLIYRFLFFYLN